MIKPREEIVNIVPYIPGRPIEDVQREYGLEHVIKLASNENPLGTSEVVKKALIDYINGGINIYPDGNATNLKEKLSKKLNLQPNNFLITNGGDESLSLVAEAYLNPTDEVILSELTFPRYTDSSTIMGAKINVVPMKNLNYDLNAICENINSNTKLIWICNPNNPTGTLLTEKEITDFLDTVPEDILVIYDEAYIEFADSEDAPKNAYLLFQKYPNVLTVKTFSKIYGLAGLRVGYLTGQPEIIENINKVRGPFNCNVLGQIAAINALDDEDFLKKVYDNNIEGKKYLYKVFEELNISYTKSQTNHIFFEAPSMNSKTLFEKMQKKGVIIRPFPGNYVRVSIGTKDENEEFAKVLKEVIQEN
ncbi:histidinol phosphate aminotransferase apoenzyme [Anaerosphaera aminiphila DSM 21120]|uniref:Histidinol-phosphate aminotransferase n=1 Tax=Anaerosphaera aminiphila DSM 21120 TaxID=1120995 RepID=A0A1M5PGS4_9FIRM|nr:histidinol-phosphate transaminase [Anaerosphaera aminiphila]SHH00950.1 histidinol phosphate aminotransferase apoenzyme [Anaerosphaera aminiphila DSM 21120]